MTNKVFITQEVQLTDKNKVRRRTLIGPVGAEQIIYKCHSASLPHRCCHLIGFLWYKNTHKTQQHRWKHSITAHSKDTALTLGTHLSSLKTTLKVIQIHLMHLLTFSNLELMLWVWFKNLVIV